VRQAQRQLFEFFLVNGKRLVLDCLLEFIKRRHLRHLSGAEVVHGYVVAQQKADAYQRPVLDVHG
jgi:hypothetical protein